MDSSCKAPNLVYVFADQLRYQSVGFNGDKLAQTPHLDALASECVNMGQCVSGHPVCSAYRASLVTGKYTTGGTGMVINEIRINTGHHSIAHVLDDAGYETSYIGKWHMYANQFAHHYDVKNSYIPEGPDRLGFNDYFAAYNFHHEYYAPNAYYHLNSPEKIYCSKYEPDEQTDMAIERLKHHKASGRPFALFLSYGTPHDPWTPENVPVEYLKRFENTEFTLPPNYKSRNDHHADPWARFKPGKRKELLNWMKCYYAMVANLDDNVGRLYDHLKSEGMLDDTIFVFTSDHGEMFGAQGRHAKNIFYEESVRVPFLMRYGANLPNGTRNESCFNTVDIMPTLLGMMGLDIPGSCQGLDISSAITSGSEVDDPCLMMGTGPTAIFGDGAEWRAIRSRRFTYAIYRWNKEEFLFDNENDPYQLHNLIKDPSYADTAKDLRALMYKKMAAIGDHFEKTSYYKKHWIKDRIIQIT